MTLVGASGCDAGASQTPVDGASDAQLTNPGSTPDGDTGQKPDASTPDTGAPDTMLPVAVGSAIEDGPCRAYLPSLPYEGLPPVSDGETIWTAYGRALMAYNNGWRIVGPGGAEFMDATKQPPRFDDMVAAPGIFAVTMGEEVFVKMGDRELRLKAPPLPTASPYHPDLHLDGNTLLISSSTGVYRLNVDKWQRLGAEFSAVHVIGKNGIYHATTPAGLLRYENGVWTGVTGVSNPIGIANRGDSVLYYISYYKLARVDKQPVNEPECPQGVSSNNPYEQIMGGGGRLIVQRDCNNKLTLWELKGDVWESIDVNEQASLSWRAFELDSAGRLSRAKGQAFYENGKWVPLPKTIGTPDRELHYSKRLGFYGMSSNQGGVRHLKDNTWTVLPGSESVKGNDVWAADNGEVFATDGKVMHFRPSQGWERKGDWPTTYGKIIGRSENDVVFGGGSRILYRWNGTTLETLPPFPCFDSSELLYFTLLGKNQIVGGLCTNSAAAYAFSGTSWEPLGVDGYNVFTIGPADAPMLLTHNAVLTTDGVTPLVPETPKNTYLAAESLDAVAYLDGNRVVRLNATRTVASEYTTFFDGPGALGIDKQLVASNKEIAWRAKGGYVVVCKM